MIVTNDFIDQMLKDVHTCKNFAEKHWLVALPEALSWKDSLGWSVIDIMEHLAAFATHYLPEIEAQIEIGINKGLGPKETYTYTPELVDFFNSLSYEGLGYMESVGHFKEIEKEVAANYPNNPPDFIAIQNQLIKLLNAAKSVDIETLVLPSLIADANFKLGSCFLFLIKHQILHFAQAEKIMEAYIKKNIEQTQSA